MSDDFIREQIEITGSSDLGAFDYTPTMLSAPLCEHAARSRKLRKLILVLGAGILYPSSLPTWQTLIKRAGENALKDSVIPEIVDLIRTSHLSPIAQVRLLETVPGLKAAFRSYLVRALYENYVPGRRSKANLVAIANLVVGDDDSPGIDSIITYNFDNLLEIALHRCIARKRKPFRVVSVITEQTFRNSLERNTIRVFHPHGFMPFNANLADIVDLPLIFSEEDYHAHFLNHTFWANTVQISSFTGSTCLFIGLSFVDPNLRRLLDLTRCHAGTEHRIAIRALHKDTVKRGSRNIENYIIEKDLQSLGVNTLWVEANDDIPAILRRIMAI